MRLNVPAGHDCGAESRYGPEIRQFHYTPADFNRVRELLYKSAGISLGPNKRDMVYSRLARRLRCRGVGTFSEYIDLVENGDHQEFEAFINALTTNLTAFFRESHHFPILAQHMGSIGRGRNIRIWSCAASTGEEPYSLAMTAVEHFDSFNPPVAIFASDIDTNVLERAERGVYPIEHVQKLSPGRLKRFFLKGDGKHAGFVKVRPELRKLITFRRLNLLDLNWSIGERFDAIFCRNVMIYFDMGTQYRILKKFVPLLQPDGLLFAGHSESYHHADDLFRIRQKTVYVLNSDGRPADGGRSGYSWTWSGRAHDNQSLNHR